MMRTERGAADFVRALSSQPVGRLLKLKRPRAGEFKVDDALNIPILINNYIASMKIRQGAHKRAGAEVFPQHPWEDDPRARKACCFKPSVGIVGHGIRLVYKSVAKGVYMCEDVVVYTVVSSVTRNIKRKASFSCMMISLRSGRLSRCI